jgi:hypothetical protein
MINTFVACLKELYEVGSLDEKDQKEYYLIERYSDKVSARLLSRQETLRKLGKQRWSESVHRVVSSPNSFLSLLPKNDSFSGPYLPVPLVYGDSKK